MRAVRIIVKGKVQGVFFRKHTREIAIKLGINGYVKNLPDGSVLIEAHGNIAEIEEFIVLCKKGPDRSVVSTFELNELSTFSTNGDFEIRR